MHRNGIRKSGVASLFFIILTEISMSSAEVIVTKAFKTHFIKEVGQSQLIGAAKTLLGKDKHQELKGAEKAKLIVPLAEALLAKKIIEVAPEASLQNLSRTDVKKISTF